MMRVVIHFPPSLSGPHPSHRECGSCLGYRAGSGPHRLGSSRTIPPCAYPPHQSVHPARPQQAKKRPRHPLPGQTSPLLPGNAASVIVHGWSSSSEARPAHHVMRHSGTVRIDVADPISASWLLQACTHPICDLSSHAEANAASCCGIACDAIHMHSFTEHTWCHPSSKNCEIME
jgi:hypothetical protein|eukprot:COSAG02_NODE_3679_length_6390_cov_3.572405_4_plen_175_part_00